MAYRWIVATFFTGAVVFSIYNHVTKFNEIGKFFIYLTNWGILLCMVCTLYGAILVTLCYFHPKQETKIIIVSNNTNNDSNIDGDVDDNSSRKMPVIFKCYWYIHNVTLILSIIITIVYWAILYDTGK